MTDKPKPIILDEAMNDLMKKKTFISRHAREELIGISRRADRFIFSDEASGLIGRFAVECGDLVLRHRQFAIPPFNDCYIELGYSFLDALAGAKNPTDAGFGVRGDTGLGYLLSGDHIYIMARSGDEYDRVSLLLPFYYTWAPPGEIAVLDPKTRGHNIMLVGEARNWNKLACAYGTSQMKITDEDERQSLLNQVQPHLMADYAVEMKRRHGPDVIIESIKTIMTYSAGDVRNVWAALLWLNRPVHTTLTNQPPGRRFIGNKQVAYKAYRTVEIDLHKFRSIRRAFTLSGERMSPRRHKVRGCFHHKYGTINCSHEWPLIPDDNQHWICTRCGRVRWWTKDHVRGDASKGWVDHDYSIITGEEPTNQEQSQR